MNKGGLKNNSNNIVCGINSFICIIQIHFAFVKNLYLCKRRTNDTAYERHSYKYLYPKKMKRIALSLLFFLCLTMGWAQKFTCKIAGYTTDANTKKLYLVESGADIRTESELITIPIDADGKFSYTLKGDTLLYYELIPADQYEKGSWRPAYFFLENQTVNIAFGTNRDKVVVAGTGRETKMMQRCNEEIDAAYNAVIDAITQKMDSTNAILENETKNMDDEQRKAYIAEFFSDNSTNPYASAYKQLRKESDDAFINKRIATVKWLDEHPCLYGLADMRLSLSSRRGASAPTTPYHLRSYKNTYGSLYKGHSYHASIRNALSAIDLVPGNKYIDYDVCDADGKTVKLSSLFTGKLIYIDLWASWCGPCRKHAKELIPLYEKYKDKGFQVIAIARERKEENMLKAIEKDGYPWLCLLELNDKKQIWWKNGLSNAGGGGFLIDNERTILAVYPDAEETEKYLKSKLDGGL